MKVIGVLLIVGLLALAGCGGDSDESPPQAAGAPAGTGDEGATGEDAEGSAREAAEGATGDSRSDDRGGGTADGTEITVGDSEFGSMLFDSNDQAIYIFENDPNGETVCYGECAEAWPPVLTDGEPQAGEGVDRELLGTIERRDGELQVTYAGQPLYFYVDEGPGEVRCHNVDLNGGLWWVVGPDGERRP